MTTIKQVVVVEGRDDTKRLKETLVPLTPLKPAAVQLTRQRSNAFGKHRLNAV